jgi:DNA-binding NtrC family response regulator
MATILVVDSGSSLLSLLVNCLSSRGHVVLVAQDGDSAVQVSRDRDLDLLVCDSGTLQDGCGVVQKVKRYHPLVRTILVSETKDVTPCLVDVVLCRPSPKRLKKALKDSLPPPP